MYIVESGSNCSLLLSIHMGIGVSMNEGFPQDLAGNISLLQQSLHVTANTNL